jgi:hypothetical protein
MLILCRLTRAHESRVNATTMSPAQRTSAAAAARFQHLLNTRSLGRAHSQLCQSGRAGDLGSSLKGLGAGGAVLIGGDVVASEMKEVADLVVGSKGAAKVRKTLFSLAELFVPVSGTVYKPDRAA